MLASHDKKNQKHELVCNIIYDVVLKV